MSLIFPSHSDSLRYDRLPPFMYAFIQPPILDHVFDVTLRHDGLVKILNFINTRIGYRLILPQSLRKALVDWQRPREFTCSFTASNDML